MPPLYNTYGAKTLRSKFCKDKQNWTFDLDLLKTQLIWNFVFTTLLQPGINDLNLIIMRTWSWCPSKFYLLFFFLFFFKKSLGATTF